MSITLALVSEELVASLSAPQKQALVQALESQQIQLRGRLGDLFGGIADWLGGVAGGDAGGDTTPGAGGETTDWVARLTRLLKLAKIIAALSPTPVDNQIVAILEKLLSQPDLIKSVFDLFGALKPAVTATPTPAPVTPVADPGFNFPPTS